MAQVMNAEDAVSGSLAECFITVEGTRYNFMSMYEFESDYEVNLAEVPILGQTNKGNKPAGGKGTWSGTAHYNQSLMRELAYQYQNTGKLPYFDIQVTNEDLAAAIGRQTIIHKKCLIDKFVLSKFSADEEILDEELSGTFERFEMPEKFNLLTGMA